VNNIEQCVEDVVAIANGSHDCELAKKRVEQLFIRADVFARIHQAALVQRVHDHLTRPHFDAHGEAKDCLRDVIEWLDHRLKRDRVTASAAMRRSGSSSK